jgi:hypothetical protein
MSYFNDTLNKLKYGRRLRPAQDWHVLLAVAAALLVACIAWNLWLLDRVKSGAALVGAAPSATALDANEQSQSAIQESFAARAIEESNYEASTSAVVDPSPE